MLYYTFRQRDGKTPDISADSFGVMRHITIHRNTGIQIPYHTTMVTKRTATFKCRSSFFTLLFAEFLERNTAQLLHLCLRIHVINGVIIDNL
jgi:hypothetical protein